MDEGLREGGTYIHEVRENTEEYREEEHVGELPELLSPLHPTYLIYGQTAEATNTFPNQVVDRAAFIVHDAPSFPIQ